LRDYELVFIVRPDLEDEAVQGLIDRVAGLIREYGGEVKKVEPWGRRKFAYFINRYREGYYVLMQFVLNARRVADLERWLLLNEDVVRHLIVRLDEVALKAKGAPAEPAVASEAPEPEAAEVGAASTTEE
jgi:small subunit ribosomal protein S6